jgi:hypothetical protein
MLPSDTARFRIDDPDPLVTASFACPLCLRNAVVDWQLCADGYDPSVECQCTSCNELWRVYVTPQQELRLRLMASAAA